MSTKKISELQTQVDDQNLGDAKFICTEGGLSKYATGSQLQAAASNKYSSGWITAPTNTNSVTLNHNLGTDELIIEAYMAKDANGTDAHKIDLIMRITAQTAESGVGFRDVTNTALTVQAGASGWIHMNSSGQIVAGSWGTTYTHIKVLAIG
jgi:hypothetical protein